MLSKQKICNQNLRSLTLELSAILSHTVSFQEVFPEWVDEKKREEGKNEWVAWLIDIS